MTFESEFARMSGAANTHFTGRAVEVAKEIRTLLDPRLLQDTRGVRRAREAMADRIDLLLVAARDSSMRFLDVDGLPIAVRADEYGDTTVDPVADAAGTLAGTLARAAVLLTGLTPHDLTTDSTGHWATGVLADVRAAADEVIRRAPLGDS